MRRTTAITLDNPLRVGGADVFELEMKEPTMAEEEDSMALAVDMGRGNVPLTNEMCMYSLLCNVPYEAVRTMTSADYEKLRRAYNGFVRPIGRAESRRNSGTPPKNSGSSAGASSGSDASQAGEEAN